MDEFKPTNLDPAVKKKPGCGAGCLAVFVIVALIFGIVWIVSSLNSLKNEPYDPNWSGEVISQCEDLVRQNLKAPSTAKFDSSATGDGTWVVTGTVDSENSFGATLRAEFQCTVIVEGESVKRRLDYLN